RAKNLRMRSPGQAPASAGRWCVFRGRKSKRKEPRTLQTGAHSGRKFSSIEDDGIIRKVFGGQLLCTHRDFEWINRLRRRGGGADWRVRERPSGEASQDQSGGADCEESGLAHVHLPFGCDVHG